MTSSAQFGAMLSRLLAHRELHADALAGAAGVPYAELAAVLDGGEPSDPLLRGLAPTLGLHTSDLLLIAGHRVPDDLAPAGPTTPGATPLVWCMANIPEAGRHVHEKVRAMPPSARLVRSSLPAYDKWFLPGFGATLLRLLGNRNITDCNAVEILYLLAGFGPWSCSTLRTVGRKGKEVSADLLAACAVVLGIQAGDLAALAGVNVPERPRVANPVALDAAEMLWDARSLAAAQMRSINVQAHLIRHEYDDVVPSELLCHCPLSRGVRRA